jgi:hypothetical protein
VELEAERLTRLDEEKLAGDLLGHGPDQLMTPRLLDLLRLRGEAVETADVG